MMNGIQTGEIYITKERGRLRGKNDCGECYQGDLLLVVAVTYTPGLFGKGPRGKISFLLPNGCIIEDVDFNQRSFDELFRLVTPRSSEFKKKKKKKMKP